MSRYTLLTGATGLVGTYILRDLLSRNERVAVIACRNQQRSVRERIETSVQRWERELGAYLPRPLCIEGDVTQPGLGLNDSDCVWIKQNCSRMVHAAESAQRQRAKRSEEPWMTNFDGTRHTLDVCRTCYVDDFHYVSTAYVAGQRDGVIREDELDLGQTFRNDFEASKFEAEKLVRSAPFLNRLTVYRPTTATGDSATGYTNEYQGVYVYLRLIAMLARRQEQADKGPRTTVKMPVGNEVPRNLVPVNWVSSVISRLLETPEAWGRTYHLASQRPTTTKELVDAACRFFGVTVAKLPAQQSEEFAEKIGFENKDLSAIHESSMPSEPLFDCTNLRQHASEIPCPSFCEELISRYCEYGEADGWGKRQECPADVSTWSDAIVTAARPDVIGALMDGIATTSSTTLGLDVVGPGGGQWSLHRGPHNLLAVTPGLPGSRKPVVRVTNDDLLRLLESPRQSAA